MTVRRHDFGPTTVAKVRDAADLGRLLIDPWFSSETIIIKPNWVSTEPADFTDARTLRTLFEALEARFVVVESHMLLRSMNLHPAGKAFTAGGKQVNWQWLLKGDGWRWLVKHPDWAWFKEGGHWDQIREEEEYFLQAYGFADLFKEFDVTYVNVTEEVWHGRVADPAAVEQAVTSRFQPLQVEQLYHIVPQKLYALRGSTFISLAKLKTYASLTMKNLFGLIPDPLRPWWHGPDNCRATASIVDVNKVYHALFNVVGICEALYATAVAHPEGQHQGVYTPKYNVRTGPGVVAIGRHLPSLDAFLLHLAEGSMTVSPPLNQAPIEAAEPEFGTVDREAFEAARTRVGSWFLH